MTIKADGKAKHYFKCRIKVDTSVRTSNESPNSLAMLFVTREIFSGSTEASKCSLILIQRCYVVLDGHFRKHITGKFVNVKSYANHRGVSHWVSQRSNARRVRSSRHTFTKENTDKSRKFHFNRKT